MVSEAVENNCAAIASTGAAKVYGIRVLAENIQQNEDNVTRFYVLSKATPNTAASGRMMFTATGDASALPRLLEAMADNGIELVSLHDRPEKNVLGSYVYLIECVNAGYAEFEKLAAIEGFEFRYYGAFPVMSSNQCTYHECFCMIGKRIGPHADLHNSCGDHNNRCRH